MFSLDHYEWRMPRMHYGRVGTREYARKLYRDAEGNRVPPMFPEPEEQFREFPFVGYPHEQTVSRKVIMPHFQRMAMEQRTLRGCATFQLAPDDDLPKKRGRPSKTARVTWEPPRAFTGECQCEVLFQNKQKVRSVAGYTEDFINQAKLCRPKSAEMWCGWYKHGLRKDIQAQLKGVLEPLEFALVQRMAGFAIEAEGQIEAMKTRQGKQGREKPTMGVVEPTKEKRECPREPSTGLGGCDCGVLILAAQRSSKVRDYLEEFLHAAKQCMPKPAEEWCRLFKVGLRREIREKLDGVLEPLEFALVKRIASQAITAEERIAEKITKTEHHYVLGENGDPVQAVGDIRMATLGSEDDSTPTRGGGWLSE
ncbi:Uncharacterized protein Rs2_52585 [Raphanus sativus]|nr:Uncharacterized protein Rs2_52585 [Raphanus sativus]